MQEELVPRLLCILLGQNISYCKMQCLHSVLDLKGRASNARWKSFQIPTMPHRHTLIRRVLIGFQKLSMRNSEPDLPLLVVQALIFLNR